MISFSRVILVTGFCFFYSVLLSQNDSVHYAKDSVIELQDCFDLFFQRNEKITSPQKIMLVQKNGKTISLKAFLGLGDKELFPASPPQYGLADLDQDGKKELVTYSYSGGAHCCDEFNIFKNISPGKYQHVAKTFAGDVCITEKNEFVYNFYQQFGYFFTCFACEFQDESGMGPQPVSEIKLKYNKGKLTALPGDNKLRATINDNLSILGKRPYKRLSGETDFDDGLRKAVALNLVVFHYSFGHNLVETKKLFDKYYRFPDAKKVWDEFLKTMNRIRSGNDF